MSSLRRILAVGLPTAGLTVFTALALGGSPAAAGPADQVVAYPAVAVTPSTSDDGYGNAAPDATDEPTDDTPTRGNNGYGTPSPTASSPTPTASTDTVPPGVSPTTATPGAAATTPGGGVSAGHELPVTGAPMGAIVSMGGLLVAAGVGSVWYTRRRRSA
ncbi:MAG: LPXTG cell wall anchor domain-containing protein [Actinoplanes sp.]